MMTRSALPLTAILLALLAMPAMPLSAQQSPQDYTLPPNPTPTPPVEGPVDDSGPVPIRPRVIPTPTPTPSPIPTATRAPVAGPTAASTPRAPAARTPVPRTDAATSPNPAPTQTQTLPSAAEQPAPEINPFASDDLTRPSLEPVAPDQPVEAAREIEPVGQPESILPEWWAWAAGLLAALLTGGLAIWAFTRRRTLRPAPVIEPPVVRATAEAQADIAITRDPARISTTFEIERLTRSLMALTLKYRLTIANRSDWAVRDLVILADLASARRNLPMEQQLASGATRLSTAASIDRIGPRQSATITGELRLPISEIEIFQQGQMPLCVPMARVRVEGEGIEPHSRNFLVGLGSGAMGGRVHPLPLSGPPGGYDGAQIRPLD